MLFILSFLLLMVGFAMVVVGRVPVTRMWTIPARVSRAAGAIFLAAFPAPFIVRWLLHLLEWESVNTVLVDWLLFALCLLAGGGWILYAGGPPRHRPARPRRQLPQAEILSSPAPPAPGGSVPFPAPPAKRPAPPQQNPFDFS